MSHVKLKSAPTDLCAVLRGVLEDAAQTVPEAQRTSSLMACLAEKILSLAADGETDVINLRRFAIKRVQDSCAACGGCEGLHPVRRSHFRDEEIASVSAFGEEITSVSACGRRRVKTPPLLYSPTNRRNEPWRDPGGDDRGPSTLFPSLLGE